MNQNGRSGVRLSVEKSIYKYSEGMQSLTNTHAQCLAFYWIAVETDGDDSE